MLNVRSAGVNDEHAAISFGYGAAVGIDFRQGPLYAGIDIRYLDTSKRDGLKFETAVLLANIRVNF